jgi:hypothetical protein
VKRDWRENMPDDFDEIVRVIIAEVRANLHTVFPAIVTKDSDGNVTEMKIATKSRKVDADGKVSYVDYPTLKTVPTHFIGGGGKDEDSVLLTHPVKAAKDSKDKHDDKQSDEGFIVISRNALDNWHDKSGVQDPISDRAHNLSDAIFVPGLRSKPRAVKHFDNKTAQLRSADKKHVLTNDPKAGLIARSVDEVKDKEKDPYDEENAKRYYDWHVKASVGYRTRAIKDGVSHKHELTHDKGHVIDVKDGKHKTTVHPDNGAGLSADDGKHKVEALPGQVKLTSSSKVEADAPLTSVTQDFKAGRDIMADRDLVAARKIATPILQAAQAAIGAIGAVGGGALNSGGGPGSGLGAGAMQDKAAATNILNTAGFENLPVASNNATAAAAGVVVGGLYRTNADPAVVCVRTA